MISRRTLTAGLALLPATAPSALASDYLGAIRRTMAALPSGPVLLPSYIVNTGAAATDFDLTQANAAYVYDNALAGLALLAGGEPTAACRIGAALEIAQTHDRFWTDGRLRNAYQAGAMTTPARLPGWWDRQASQWREDPYQAGTATGPLAWAMLLWIALGQTAPAQRAADWIIANLSAPQGFYGGFYGFEPHPLKQLWQSTEQNIDVYAAFAKLRLPAAASAKTFVVSRCRTGVFEAGLTPGGAANPLLAADAGIWPYLAGIGTAASALAAIQKLQHGNGIGFSAASHGIWLEGTAFAALALHRAQHPLATNFTSTIAANTAPNGYVYATAAPTLATGLTTGPSLIPGQPETKFSYFRRPCLSATAWATLAQLGIDALR